MLTALRSLPWLSRCMHQVRVPFLVVTSQKCALDLGHLIEVPLQVVDGEKTRTGADEL